MAVALSAGTTNAGNTIHPAITVPAGCSVGDILLIQLGENNSDVVTATPSGLTELPVTQLTQLGTHMYWALVDGTTISPSTVLTWTLSATRQWTVVIQGFSGVDNTTPINQWAATLTAGTATVTPSITTTASAFMVEIACLKAFGSSGTPVTGITPPAGWTQDQFRGSAITYSQAVTLADKGTQPAGTYGTDTYTPAPSTTDPTALYTIGLNPVSAPAYSDGAAMSGSGSLAGTGAPAVPATAGLSGSGAVSMTTMPALAVAAALAGAGALSIARSPAWLTAVTLGGSGSLANITAPGMSSAATLSGAGTLTAATAPTWAGTATLGGSGALAATGGTSPTGPASLAGGGSLTATTAPQISAMASLNGSGGLSVGTAPAMAAVIPLSGAGELTATVSPAMTGAAGLSGSGTLAGSGGTNPTGTAALSGSGWLSGSVIPAITSTAGLSGMGGLALIVAPKTAANAALSGSGLLSAVSSANPVGTAGLSGSGGLTAVVMVIFGGPAQLSGAGALTAIGFNPTISLPLYTVRAASRIWAAPVTPRVWGVRDAGRHRSFATPPRRWQAPPTNQPLKGQP